MADNGTELLLGKLLAKVEGIGEDLHEMKEEHHERLNRHGEQIAELQTESAVRKAGGRWLVGLLTASAAIGATIAELARVVLMGWRGH